MSRDRDQIHAFFEDPSTPLPVETPPLAKALGGTLMRFDAGAKTLTMAFTPGEMFLQGNNVIQGGAVASMLDLTCAFLGLGVVPAEKTIATVTLNVSYLKGAKAGPHRVDAEIERQGRSHLFCRAALHPEDDEQPTATASAVFSIFDARSG